MLLLKFVCTFYTSMKHDPVLSTNELLKIKAKTIEHTRAHTHFGQILCTEKEKQHSPRHPAPSLSSLIMISKGKD